MGIIGSIMRYILGSEDSTVDPATGLTNRQKKLLVDSWAVLGSRKEQKKHGVALFIHLFKAFPAQQDFFPMFKDKDSEELKVMPQMRAHAATLMSQMSSFIDNLDDPECLAGLMQKVARNHIKRNVAVKEFEELRGVFGSYLDDELGATPEVKEAWDKMLVLLTSAIEEAAKEAESQSTETE